VVGVVSSYVFEVVVLSGYAQAFLGVDCPNVVAHVCSEEDVFELHHPGVGEEEGRVSAGHERRGADEFVVFGFEEVNI